jgi:hypothetical protein
MVLMIISMPFNKEELKCLLKRGNLGIQKGNLTGVLTIRIKGRYDDSEPGRSS